MESIPLSIHQVFQERRQYCVPFYQRAYVWSQEDQWSRLWEDIAEKADLRLCDDEVVPHYLGAVVLEPQLREKKGLIGVEKHHIIDGQQRLTTFQYILAALALTLESWNQTKFLPLVKGCLQNSNPDTMRDSSVESYKLWPTFRDREHFVRCMTVSSINDLRTRFPESFTKAGDLRKVGISHPPPLEAIWYFYHQMLAWERSMPEDLRSGAAEGLATAILTDFSVICISLGDGDDAQVIFETLNGRGATLHATDLIRNFLFMRAGENSSELYSNFWVQFESPLWSEPQTRGRLKKPRMEWFVQTVVEAETGNQIDIGRLYSGYRQFVDGTPKFRSADAQLELLNKYAVHYYQLVTGTGSTPVGVFGRRMSVWDVSIVHPLALRVAETELSDDDKTRIYDCIESYIVRRAICGYTNKGLNNVFAQLLKKFRDAPLDSLSFFEAMKDLKATSSLWPKDEILRTSFWFGEIYPGRLDAPKVRAILHRIETAMRSEKSEERVPLTFDDLDIDHILPKKWGTYWPLDDGRCVTDDEIQTAEMLMRLPGSEANEFLTEINIRETAIPTFGNLTLAHYGINRSYQNHAFPKKRDAFFQHSNLHLNRELMLCERWNEDAIRSRGVRMFEIARTIWRGPE